MRANERNLFTGEQYAQDEEQAAAALGRQRPGAVPSYSQSLAHGTAVEVPSFTLDAMVSYTTGPWRFALNATNLADKTYIGSCTYGCFYGEPRRIIGTATYRW